DEPVSGELDETTWTRCYRGGWQLLVPNAGNACVVDGIAHGFHGRASTDAWEVTDLAVDAACLGWEGHGIRVRRRFTLADDTVAVAGGQADEVDERTGPTEPPADAPRWPEVRLLDGTLERGDRAELRTPRRRMMIVANVPEGHLTVHNHDRRQGLELSWDTTW